MINFTYNIDPAVICGHKVGYGLLYDCQYSTFPCGLVGPASIIMGRIKTGLKQLMKICNDGGNKRKGIKNEDDHENDNASTTNNNDNSTNNDIKDKEEETNDCALPTRLAASDNANHAQGINPNKAKYGKGYTRA